jgi:hypothetical protein
MAFAWKCLLPLALINILISAFEVLIWEEYGLNAGVVLPIFAMVNLALSGVLLAVWIRMMSRPFLSAPRRPRLFSDIGVPLPGEPATGQAV